MDFSFAVAFVQGKAPSGAAMWQVINEGPPIVRPTRLNSHEPLKKIEEVDVEQVCSSAFIWKNGRQCLGMYDPHEAYGKVLLSMLISYPITQDDVIPQQVFEFIRSRFDYRLMYGASPSEDLMEQNLKLHQLVNCGAIPPDEGVIIQNKHLLRYFEQIP